MPGSDPMEIRIELHGMRGRRLWLEDRGREFFEAYAADEDPFSKSYERTELLTDAKSLALEPMRFLFSRFGWDAQDDVLRSLQQA